MFVKHAPAGRTKMWSGEDRTWMWISPTEPLVWFQQQKRRWLVRQGEAVRTSNAKGECTNVVFLADGSVVTQGIYASTRLGRCDRKGKSMGTLTLPATVTSVSGAPTGEYVWATAGRHLVRIDSGGIVEDVEMADEIVYGQAVGLGVVLTFGQGNDRRHALVDQEGQIRAEARGEQAFVDRYARSVWIREPAEGSPAFLSFDGSTAHDMPLSVNAIGGPAFPIDRPGLYQLQLATYHAFRWHTLPSRAIGAACRADGSLLTWVDAEGVMLAPADELSWVSGAERRLCVEGANGASLSERTAIARVLAEALRTEAEGLVKPLARGDWLGPTVVAADVDDLRQRLDEVYGGLIVHVCPPH